MINLLVFYCRFFSLWFRRKYVFNNLKRIQLYKCSKSSDSMKIVVKFKNWTHFFASMHDNIFFKLLKLLSKTYFFFRFISFWMIFLIFNPKLNQFIKDTRKIQDFRNLFNACYLIMLLFKYSCLPSLIKMLQ